MHTDVGTVAAMMTHSPTTAGWYRDPENARRLRWWDGRVWSQLTRSHARAPLWESTAVSASAVVGVAASAILLAAVVSAAVSTSSTAAVALLGAFVPLLIVGPILLWLGRQEPGPLWAKVHAFLIGAGVAFASATLVNTGLAKALEPPLGREMALVLAIALVAPCVEESAKWFGVRRSLRQGMIGSGVDGVVYAGIVALGFTVIEDVLYLSRALSAGKFASVFTLRCLVSPFAHTVFSMLIGAGVGLREEGKKSTWVAFPAAVLLHVAWNTSALWADTASSRRPVAIGYVICLAAGVAAVGMAATWARRAGQETRAGLPELQAATAVTAAESKAVLGGRAWSKCVRQAPEGWEVAQERLLAVKYAARVFARTSCIDTRQDTLRRLPEPLST